MLKFLGALLMIVGKVRIKSRIANSAEPNKL